MTFIFLKQNIANINFNDDYKSNENSLKNDIMLHCISRISQQLVKDIKFKEKFTNSFRRFAFKNQKYDDIEYELLAMIEILCIIGNAPSNDIIDTFKICISDFFDTDDQIDAIFKILFNLQDDSYEFWNKSLIELKKNTNQREMFYNQDLEPNIAEIGMDFRYSAPEILYLYRELGLYSSAGQNSTENDFIISMLTSKFKNDPAPIKCELDIPNVNEAIVKYYNNMFVPKDNALRKEVDAIIDEISEMCKKKKDLLKNAQQEKLEALRDKFIFLANKNSCPTTLEFIIYKYNTCAINGGIKLPKQIELAKWDNELTNELETKIKAPIFKLKSDLENKPKNTKLKKNIATSSLLIEEKTLGIQPKVKVIIEKGFFARIKRLFCNDCSTEKEFKLNCTRSNINALEPNISFQSKLKNEQKFATNDKNLEVSIIHY